MKLLRDEPAIDVLLWAKKLKRFEYKRHREVLEYLVSKRVSDTHFYFVSFDRLSSELGYTRSEVRRSARYLLRKGLAQFSSGLFNDDGGVAGSGYAATSMGSAVWRVIDGTD